MEGLSLIFVFLIALFGFLAIGVPIAYTLVLVAVSLLLAVDNFEPTLIAQSVVFGANSFTLLAIPFFILAGEVMSHGGISLRIVRFVANLVGHVRGGLGYVVIIASTIFAGLSGSAVADAAALGAILIPMMVRMGYDKALSAALICAAAMIAPIIPPSIPFILYGVAGQVSIGRLFMAGIVPGLILSASLMLFWFFVSRRNDFPVGKRVSWAELVDSFKKAAFALLMPFIIIGGIRFGVFTPTEAGCVAVVYAMFISIVVYREMELKDVYTVLVSTAKTTGMVLLVASTATAAAWVVTTAGVPQAISQALSGFASLPLLLMLVINVFLVALGMVMDLVPAMLIFTPIFVPLVKSVGIDPVYFGVIMSLNLVIGLITPPVGTVLYVACGVAKIGLTDLVKKLWPLVMVELAVLILLIVFPEITLVPLRWFI